MILLIVIPGMLSKSANQPGLLYLIIYLSPNPLFCPKIMFGFPTNSVLTNRHPSEMLLPMCAENCFRSGTDIHGLFPPPLQGCVKPGLTSYDHRFTSYRCRRRISDRLGSDRPSIRFEALVAIWTASSRIGLSSNCKNGFIRIPLPTIHPLAIHQGYCSGV